MVLIQRKIKKCFVELVKDSNTLQNITNPTRREIEDQYRKNRYFPILRATKDTQDLQKDRCSLKDRRDALTYEEYFWTLSPVAWWLDFYLECLYFYQHTGRDERLNKLAEKDSYYKLREREVVLFMEDAATELSGRLENVGSAVESVRRGSKELVTDENISDSELATYTDEQLKELTRKFVIKAKNGGWWVAAMIYMSGRVLLTEEGRLKCLKLSFDEYRVPAGFVQQPKGGIVPIDGDGCGMEHAWFPSVYIARRVVGDSLSARRVFHYVFIEYSYRVGLLRSGKKLSQRVKLVDLVPLDGKNRDRVKKEVLNTLQRIASTLGYIEHNSIRYSGGVMSWNWVFTRFDEQLENLVQFCLS